MPTSYGYKVEIPNGEQFNTYASTDERWPVGTLGYLQDGRAYRFSQAGGSTLVIGNVIAAVAPVANHVNLTAAATAVGSRTIACALGATAMTANQYKNGWINVSVAPGSGQMYAIPAHAAVASSGTFTASLDAGDAVRVALTTTSRLDLIANPYRGVIQAPATTLTSPPVGVAVSAPTTGQFCWIQVLGPASVLTAGTVVIGEQVIAPTGTAGACGPNSVGGAETEAIIGRVLRVAATTAWSTIDLCLGN